MRVSITMQLVPLSVFTGPPGILIFTYLYGFNTDISPFHPPHCTPHFALEMTIPIDS